VAIYHLSAKIISRGNGNSAVAAAAYRSADKLNNYRTNETYNYKRKQSVDYTEIFLPDNAPSEFYNREILWNSVEQNEKQKNAQLAREIEFALPNELNFEQQKNLAREFAMSFARQGMCVDLAFHDKKNNPHCHLLLTLRGLDEQGNWSPKCKKVNNRRVNFNNWNDKETLEKWRKDWEVMANLSLSEAGFKEQIDHRSYKKQGVEKIPTIHLGKASNVMEKANQPSKRGNINREIHQLNLFGEKIKPTLENYVVIRKKIPPTDDPRSFMLWIFYASRNIQREIERLQKDIDSGIEKSKFDNEIKIINQQIADEQQRCEQNIRELQQNFDDQIQAFQQKLLQLQTQIGEEEKNLADNNENFLLLTEEFKNFESAKADLADSNKKCVALKKNWDHLYDELSKLPKNAPDYDEKLQECNNARANYQKTFAKTVPKKQDALKIASELLKQKRLSLPTSNSKLDALNAEITKIETLRDKKSDDLKAQIENLKAYSKFKIDNIPLQIKNFENQITVKMYELKQDDEFLREIYKNFAIQFNKRPDPLYSKFHKKGEIYVRFLINNQKKLNLNPQKYDTSASFVRQLRQTEQKIQSPSFLADLNKFLANNFADSDSSMPSENAKITSISFDMPFEWNLLSELAKDEKKHKEWSRLI